MSPARSQHVPTADPTELRLVVTKVGEVDSSAKPSPPQSNGAAAPASDALPDQYAFQLRIGSTQQFPAEPIHVDGTTVRALCDQAKPTKAISTFLDDHLKAIALELDKFADRCDVRLWVRYPAELDPIAWESLGEHGTIDQWMVVRECQRPDEVARTPRVDRPLQKVLVLIGDVLPRDKQVDYGVERPQPTPPSPGPALVNLVKQLESRLGATRLVTLISQTTQQLCPSDWAALGSVKERTFDSSSTVCHELENHCDADAIVVIAHADSRGAPSPSNALSSAAPGGQATAFQLDDTEYLESADLARALRSKPGPTPRLALLLGCNAAYHMAAELHAVVDHVIGFRTEISLESAARIADTAIGAFLRQGSASVAEVVRMARGILLDERAPDGTSRASSPAHWCPTGVDEPFVDAIADTVARVHGVLVRALDTFDNLDHPGEAARLTRIHVPLRVVARRTESSSVVPSAMSRGKLSRVGTTLDSPSRIDPERVIDTQTALYERLFSLDDSLLGALGAFRRSLEQRSFLGLVLERTADGRLVVQPGITVVHGKPGSGKTTSARELTRQLARGRFGVLSLFARLPDLMAALVSDDYELSIDRIVRFVRKQTPELSTVDPVELESAARTMSSQGRLVLVLDGLDEVRDTGQNSKARDLIRVVGADASMPIAVLVTTRSSGYTDIAGARLQVEIDELGDAQQLDLLAKWNQVYGLEKHAAERKARMDLAALQSGGKSAGLLALFRVPLFLGFVARKLAEHPEAAVTAARVHTFYDEMLLDAATVPHRHGSTALCTVSEFESARLRLEAIAMFAQEHADPDREFGFVQSAAKLALENHALCSSTEATTFLGRALDAGIFVTSDANGDQFKPSSVWRFWHRAFQESLASSDLASIPTHRELVERAEELLDAGDHAAATWDEPFVLLTSRLADRQKGRSTRWFERLLNFASQRLVKGRGDRASQWIDSLLSRNVTRAAGLRAIALADNLDPKVAALAINKLADWRETHALYEYLRSPASCGSDPLVIAAIKARAAAHSRFRLRLVERRTRVKSEIDAHMEVELAAALLEERSRTKLESSAGWSIRPDAVPTKWLKPATKLEAGLFAYCHGEQSKDEAGRPLPWLVRVEAGEFTMGSERTEHGRRDNEGPWPNVSVGEFWIAREVTSNKQYQCFDSWKYAWWDYGGDGHARLTSWSEASLYCRALTRWAIDHPQLFQRDLTRGEDLHRRLKAGELVFRLPKESELEYVMRWTSAGPGTFRGAYGVNESDIEITESNLSDYAVFGLEAQEGCEPVGSKRPTTPGLLFDLHGNHWEWCLDVYEDEPLMTAADAVHARGPSDSHVQRGGGFWNESTRCRASSRGDLGPVLNETVHNAFRVVLAPPLSPLRSSPLTPLIEGGFESELDVF